MWYHDPAENFDYKTMAYNNSCFPCSLHIILQNLGHSAQQNDHIEDLWDTLQGNTLNQRAPNEGEVHHNLAQTPLQSAGITIISPTMLDTRANTQSACTALLNHFAAPGPAGMIFGINHAEVFFKNAAGHFIHYTTTPVLSHPPLTVYPSLNAVVRNGGGNNWAVTLQDPAGNDILSGQYIVLIR